jgi:hypothetical protein
MPKAVGIIRISCSMQELELGLDPKDTEFGGGFSIPQGY